MDCGPLLQTLNITGPQLDGLGGFTMGRHYHLDGRTLLFVKYTIEKKNKECQCPQAKVPYGPQLRTSET